MQRPLIYAEGIAHHKAATINTTSRLRLMQSSCWLIADRQPRAEPRAVCSMGGAALTQSHAKAGAANKSNGCTVERQKGDWYRVKGQPLITALTTVQDEVAMKQTGCSQFLKLRSRQMTPKGLLDWNCPFACLQIFFIDACDDGNQSSSLDFNSHSLAHPFCRSRVIENSFSFSRNSVYRVRFMFTEAALRTMRRHGLGERAQHAP